MKAFRRRRRPVLPGILDPEISLVTLAGLREERQLLVQMTTRRRCRAPGAASDFVKAGLTDERKKQQGARLDTARGHSSGRDSDLPAIRLQENIYG